MLSHGVGDLDVFQKTEQPVYIAANAYLNGAEGFDREKNGYYSKAFDPDIKIVEEGDPVYLEMSVEKALLDIPAKVVSTEMLGTVRIVDAIFDDPNGEPIVLDTDYTGARRAGKLAAGPIEELQAGFNHIKVWN